MTRIFFVLGSLSALMGVALGAFAAHALKSRIAPEMLAVFEVGVRYQMYHAFGLFAVAWAASHWSGADFSLAGWLFVGGTVLFSGSLYVLSLTGVKALGAVTPIGGVLFLVGWIKLAQTAFRS